MSPPKNSALKVLERNASLRSRKSARASASALYARTTFCPAKYSSTCPLTDAKLCCRARKYFCERAITANVIAKPKMVAPIAANAMIHCVINIMTRHPASIENADTMVAMLFVNDWEIVSTSLVTRESVSPKLCAS